MSDQSSSQVVTFRVGDDDFAADIIAVERVLRYAAPTAVPNLPEWVEGVLDYEGRVVPVIDLSRRFGMQRDTAPTGAGGAGGEGRAGRRIIVFAVGDGWIGAVVDAVLEVVVIPPERIAPPPELFRGLSAEYLRGLVRRGGTAKGASARGAAAGFLIFLEVEQLLSATERLVLERALQESSDGVDMAGGQDGQPENGAADSDA